MSNSLGMVRACVNPLTGGRIHSREQVHSEEFKSELNSRASFLERVYHGAKVSSMFPYVAEDIIRVFKELIDDTISLIDLMSKFKSLAKAILYDLKVNKIDKARLRVLDEGIGILHRLDQLVKDVISVSYLNYWMYFPHDPNKTRVFDVLVSLSEVVCGFLEEIEEFKFRASQLKEEMNGSSKSIDAVLWFLDLAYSLVYLYALGLARMLWALSDFK
ncbi:MAG: hypothetical protein GSR85_07915 [Desulfurococcales archaeon]|nr:hypothetical protein [Desulfurococcales archaeon]